MTALATCSYFRLQSNLTSEGTCVAAAEPVLTSRRPTNGLGITTISGQRAITVLPAVSSKSEPVPPDTRFLEYGAQIHQLKVNPTTKAYRAVMLPQLLSDIERHNQKWYTGRLGESSSLS